MTSSQGSPTDTLQSGSIGGRIRAKRRRNFFTFPMTSTPLPREWEVTSPFSAPEENKQTNPEIYNQHALYYHLLAHVPIYANGFLQRNYHYVSHTSQTHISIKARDDLLLFHNRMCFLDKSELEKTVTVLGCFCVRWPEAGLFSKTLINVSGCCHFGVGLQ